MMDLSKCEPCVYLYWQNWKSAVRYIAEPMTSFVLWTERMAQENLSNPALEIPAFIDTKIYYTGVWFSPVEHGEFFGLSGDSLKRGPDKARSQLDLAIYIDIVSLGIHCGNPGFFVGKDLHSLHIYVGLLEGSPWTARHLFLWANPSKSQ